MQTPELDKQLAIINSGEAKTVQNFLDWLREEQGYVLAKYVRVEGYRDEQLVDCYPAPEQLMADFFGVDLSKIEQERRAILDSLSGGA